eukprot:GHVU01213733.1.p1 GENE.GHVU01213733.1~~GHVU01213733.1.p1  ORF type:complete len:208 (-),score=25.90 GHVU01213733.1:50-673(-)
MVSYGQIFTCVLCACFLSMHVCVLYLFSSFSVFSFPTGAMVGGEIQQWFLLVANDFTMGHLLPLFIFLAITEWGALFGAFEMFAADGKKCKLVLAIKMAVDEQNPDLDLRQVLDEAASKFGAKAYDIKFSDVRMTTPLREERRGSVVLHCRVTDVIIEAAPLEVQSSYRFFATAIKHLRLDVMAHLPLMRHDNLQAFFWSTEPRVSV